MKTILSKTQNFSTLVEIPVDKEGHHTLDKEKFCSRFEAVVCPHCNKKIAINNKHFRNNKRLSYCSECDGYIEIKCEMKVVTEVAIELKKLILDDAPNSIKLLQKLDEVEPS